MYYVRKQILRRYIMNTIVAFFKSIFSSDAGNDMKIGLSQFKDNTPQDIRERKSNRTGEMKLSDLMRKSY